MPMARLAQMRCDSFRCLYKWRSMESTLGRNKILRKKPCLVRKRGAQFRELALKPPQNNALRGCSRGVQRGTKNSSISLWVTSARVGGRHRGRWSLSTIIARTPSMKSP